MTLPQSAVADVDATLIDVLPSLFGTLCMLPRTPQIQRDDPCLSEYRDLDLNVDEILLWANQQDPLFRRNRQQLMLSFPVLVPGLASEYGTQNPTFMELTAAIDRGNPLVEATSRIMGLSRATTKFLMGLRPSNLGSSWLKEPITLAWAISLTPVACRPATRDDWNLYRKFWQLSGLASDLDYQIAPGHGQTRNPMAENLFVLLCRNGYSKAAQRRLHAMTVGEMDRIFNARDYFEFIADWIMNRWPGSYLDALTLGASLLMRYPLAEVVRQSIHWHDLILIRQESGFAPEQLPSESDLGSWPPLLEIPLESGGLQAISLVCSHDLADEGNRMNHCVGRYVESCATGHSHIVSIRDVSGKSISTAEIEVFPVKQDRWEGRVRQHYGPGNCSPSAECVHLIELVLIELKQTASQSRLQRIQETHDARRDEMENHLWDLRMRDLAFDERLLKEILPDFDQALKWLHHRAEDLTDE